MNASSVENVTEKGQTQGVGSGTLVRRLWLLRPVDGLPKDNPWEPWYDKAFGFVVCAETEEEARKLANSEGGDETGPVKYSVYRTGGDAWLDPKLSSCVELTADREKGIVMRDFASA